MSSALRTAAAAAALSGLVAFSAATTPPPALAQADRDLPRFVSLRANEVNLRTGPGRRYPVEWVYQRQSLPVEVVAEFDTWRRIRDWEGTTGWVHQTMLTAQRTLMVLSDGEEPIYDEPSNGAGVVARAEPGVIGRFMTCESHADVTWCQGEFEGHRGWLPESALWGIHPNSDSAP